MASSYGSRTENVLEYTLKTLADTNELLIQTDPYQGPDRQYTLLDVVPLLRAASCRHAVLEQMHDSLLIDWWQHYYEPLDAHQQREITSSVITKLSKFASSRVARRILGHPRSTIDLREVVRAGQNLLGQFLSRHAITGLPGLYLASDGAGQYRPPLRFPYG